MRLLTMNEAAETTTATPTVPLETLAPSTQAHPPSALAWVCQSDVRPSVLPSVALSHSSLT